MSSSDLKTSPGVIDDPTSSLASPPGSKPPGPDHTGLDTHTTLVGAGPILYDPGLYLLAEQLNGLEELRKATGNRLRQATRSEADKDGEVRGLGLVDQHPAVRSVSALAYDLELAEKEVVKALERAMKVHPLGIWQAKTIGVGAKQLARLLGVVGDPYWNALHDRPRTVSELWAYCGLHTLPVLGQSITDTQPGSIENGNQLADRALDQSTVNNHSPAVRGAARRKKGQRANWSTEAKTRVYLISESCVKQARSPYRAVYDARRAVTEGKVHDRPCPQCNGAGKTDLITSPWKPGHQHADAMRLAGKAMLKDLWRASRELHNAQ